MPLICAHLHHQAKTQPYSISCLSSQCALIKMLGLVKIAQTVSCASLSSFFARRAMVMPLHPAYPNTVVSVALLSGFVQTLTQTKAGPAAVVLLLLEKKTPIHLGTGLCPQGSSMKKAVIFACRGGWAGFWRQHWQSL